MKKVFPKDPIARSQLRTIQYQNIDGTFELTFSGLFLSMAVCFYILSQLSLPNSLLSNLLPVALFLIFIVGGILVDRLIQRFRERYTYPRTGYIAYRHQPRPLGRATRLMIWIGVPLITVVLLVLLFLNRSKFPLQHGQVYVLNVMPGFFGLIFSGLYAVIGWKIALPRYYLVALVSLLAGVGLLVNGLPTYLGMVLLFGAMSLSLFISGGLTLWRYLHSTRPLEDTSPKESPDEQ